VLERHNNVDLVLIGFVFQFLEEEKKTLLFSTFLDSLTGAVQIGLTERTDRRKGMQV
jgi:hypothetical protein